MPTKRKSAATPKDSSTATIGLAAMPWLAGEALRTGDHQIASFGNLTSLFGIFLVHHLVPQRMVGFVLADGTMSSNQSGESDIPRALLEADLVDCMVSLPGQLLYSTQPIEALAA